MESYWCLPPASELLVEEFDGFVACYSKATGETHILDLFPAELIHLLQADPAAAPALADALGELMGESGQDCLAQVERVLEELEGIRVVTRSIP